MRQPYRCPTNKTKSDGTPHTSVGCGSTNLKQDPSEPQTWDCLDCGMWFDPSKEPDDNDN